MSGTDACNRKAPQCRQPATALRRRACHGAAESFLTQRHPGRRLRWGVNGFAQAFGWPCMSRIFMNWFQDPAERGKLYSILSTCQNVGTALVPIILFPLFNQGVEFEVILHPPFASISRPFCYCSLASSVAECETASCPLMLNRIVCTPFLASIRSPIVMQASLSAPPSSIERLFGWRLVMAFPA